MVCRHRFLLAESGDVADDMPGQANILVERIQKGNICDAQNDWKLLTLFIGVSFSDS